MSGGITNNVGDKKPCTNVPLVSIKSYGFEIYLSLGLFSITNTTFDLHACLGNTQFSLFWAFGQTLEKLDLRQDVDCR